MLTRDKIIRSALRKVGETYTYNDNRSQSYELASTILEDILDSVATREDFLFNSTTVKLNTVGTNLLGEYKFNLPIDYLNKIRFINDTSARLESEYIYSKKEEVILQYCREIDLLEYPDYMYEYLSALLALKLSEADNAYSGKIEVLNLRVTQETNRIYQIQYSPIVISRGE